MLEWTPGKYPDEEDFYQFDWAPALASGDAVDPDTVTAPTAGSIGLVATIVSTVGTITTIKLTGGTAATVGRVQFLATSMLGAKLGDNVLIVILKR